MHQIQRKISTKLLNFISRFTLIKVISFYIWFAYSQPSQSKCDKNRALQEFQILRVLKLLSQNKNKKLTQKRKHMTVLGVGGLPYLWDPWWPGPSCRSTRRRVYSWGVPPWCLGRSGHTCSRWFPSDKHTDPSVCHTACRRSPGRYSHRLWGKKTDREGVSFRQWESIL